MIALLICAIASYTDLKERLIYDKLTYPSIALGFLFAVCDAVIGDFTGIALAAAIFAFSYALYFAGKIGGGDVKLFVALALLIPRAGNKLLFIEMLLYAALLSSAAVSCYGLFRIVKERSFGNKENIAKALLLASFLLVYLYIMLNLGAITLLGAIILGFPLVMSSIFLAFSKEINRKLFLEYVPVDELEEDEILAKEYASSKLLKLFGAKFKGIITEKDKERLKKAGINKVPVYRALPPFAPFMLAGLVLALIMPELFAQLFPYLHVFSL